MTLAIFMANNVYAENSFSKEGEPNKLQVLTSVIILTEDIINSMHVSNLSDLLRYVSGIDVVQKGGSGQEAVIFVRGAESRHTLVLIDGISANSPITGEVDFADLTVGDIDRVEIVRGPLSALYGSGAIGGAIRIFTKKANTSLGALGAETGSFDTIKEKVSTSLKTDRYDLHITASHLETEGFSTAKTGTEKDGYNNTTISSRVGIATGATGRLEISARLTESRTDLDVPRAGGRPVDVVPVDDTDLQQQKQWNLFGVSYNSNISGNWNQRLSLSNSDVEFIFSDYDTSMNRGRSNTMVKTAVWQHNIRSDDGSELTLGYEWQQQHGDIQGGFNKTFSNKSVYIQDLRGLTSPLQLLAALRWDDNTLYGSSFSYSAGMSHTPANGVRWFAQYGTGFKGPNLNDLFWPEDLVSLGNPNLKPEKNRGWEIGTEQVMSETMSVSMSYFANTYEDLIQWIPNTAGKYQPRNRREALSNGLETIIIWQPAQVVRIEGSYTYNDTEDNETHFYLQRRPLNKYGMVLLINPSGNLRMTINYNHSGRRVEWADTDFDGKPDQQNILSAYSKVDLSGSYKLSRSTEIFFRVENLFDEDYTEAIGYNTAGVSSYSGLRITL